MTEPRARLWPGVTEAWDRFVTVATSDEEEARVSRLFNVMMVLTAGVATALAGAFSVAMSQGLLPSARTAGLALIFPLLLATLAIYCFAQSKRGHVRLVSRLFIWLNFGGLVIVVFVFGGLVSPGWLLFFWPVTLASMFMRPVAALRIAIGVVFYYGALSLLERFGLYVPPVPVPLEAFRFLNIALALILLVFAAGVVGYLNMHSLREALGRLRMTSRDLTETQRTLESRVAERTAEVERRAGQFQAIAELNRAVASELDLQRLLETAVKLIAERLGFYHVGIFLIGPKGEWAVLRAASSEGGQRMLARGHRLRVGQQGIVGYVAQTSFPRFAFSVGEDAVWFNNPDLPATQSEIGLPLVTRGQAIVGVLDIQTEEPAAFNEADVAVLNILADGIAIAIANTQLLEETRATLATLERYQEQNALVAWRQALGRRNMRMSYAYDSGIVHQTTESAIPEMHDIAMPEVTTRTTAEGQHLLLAPIHVRNRPMGVLTFEKASPWAEDQIQLAQFVVEQLDLALDNARLLEETRLRANQERARGDIVGRIRAMTSTDAILRSAARELGRALQVERSRIQLLTPGEGQLDTQEA